MPESFFCYLYARSVFENPQRQYLIENSAVISDGGNELHYFDGREVIYRQNTLSKLGFYEGYENLCSDWPLAPDTRSIAIVTGPQFAELKMAAEFSIVMSMDLPEGSEDRAIRAPDGTSPDLVFSTLVRMRGLGRITEWVMRDT